jgi:hypothetical protein
MKKKTKQRWTCCERIKHVAKLVEGYGFRDVAIIIAEYHIGHDLVKPGPFLSSFMQTDDFVPITWEYCLHQLRDDKSSIPEACIVNWDWFCIDPSETVAFSEKDGWQTVQTKNTFLELVRDDGDAYEVIGLDENDQYKVVQVLRQYGRASLPLCPTAYPLVSKIS